MPTCGNWSLTPIVWAHLPAGTGLATTSGAYPHSYRLFLSELVLVERTHTYGRQGMVL